jgi:hypothetical protein
MGQKSIMDYTVTPKFDVASRYTHLEDTNETSDSNKVVKNTFKVILYIYILAPC